MLVRDLETHLTFADSSPVGNGKERRRRKVRCHTIIYAIQPMRYQSLNYFSSCSGKLTGEENDPKKSFMSAADLLASVLQLPYYSIFPLPRRLLRSPIFLIKLERAQAIFLVPVTELSRYMKRGSGDIFSAISQPGSGSRPGTTRVPDSDTISWRVQGRLVDR